MKLFERKMKKLNRDDVINLILAEKEWWSKRLSTIREVENAVSSSSDSGLRTACNAAIRALDALLDKVERLGVV
jgi:hypothetical protein